LRGRAAAVRRSALQHKHKVIFGAQNIATGRNETR
jgi:hypothetical protein